MVELAQSSEDNMDSQVESNAEQIELLAHQVGVALEAGKDVLATAESCTGGGIACAITEIAGSSVWFDAGFVTYSNEAKQRMLGVQSATLERFGAVSEDVVLEMTSGSLDRSNASVAVSVSGVAGPGGGTEDKPVGTVWIAWQRKGQSGQARKFCFSGGRHAVRQQTVVAALNGVLARLCR
ncbi:nicotinamide-nucleotide amidohydrolase family protein [Aestuariirhabdus sp. Z084]|uniref:CinA family protein n=1 Tax=Aestuariirhabdus haliotis TaxID=2918751 RepID=UPI00201B461E|nr:nicotinamide-nucleotide amidohydrolase family protein [Aestuariirhabdus haliotis]MCL6416340.1 nicotinamide-nucleotide amidohydrolase family protein [Aestuariirhabdus haliotis]MCL6420329.1 nicotinamide-nucleotide amidohydrolase family protein [Aestuariirhabdus haliotis]